MLKIRKHKKLNVEVVSLSILPGENLVEVVVTGCCVWFDFPWFFIVFFVGRGVGGVEETRWE